MNDEFKVRYTNKHGLECILVVYGTTMSEARKKAIEELGDYLKQINQITNCTFVRELIKNQDFD